MAVALRLSCPDCGQQTLRPADVQLFTTPNLHESRYGFVCPQCAAWVNRPAWPALVRDLRQLCVPERRQVPREVFEPHRGPALTADEVLDFTLEIAQVDDVARFAGRR